MKKLLPLFLITAFFTACKKNPEPIPAVEPPVSSYPFDTARYQTKEPFITLEDRGLEAFLVIDGLDSDNQVNGKISEEDANNFYELNLSTISYNNLREYKYLYFGNLYSLLELDNKEIDNSHLPKLPIKSISDLKKFPNLTNLYANCFETIETFDFSGTDKLNSISISNFGNTKIVGIDSLGAVSYNGFRHFSKDDTLIQTTLDLSQIKFVKGIAVYSISDIEFPKNTAEGIDISKSNLEGTKLNEYLAKRNLRIIRLDELPRVTSLLLVSTNNSLINVTNCRNLEQINFERVENISELVVANSPLLKTMDLSKYKDIYNLYSLGNTKLDTISINKGLDFNRKCWLNCKIEKDPWTVWKVK